MTATSRAARPGSHPADREPPPHLLATALTVAPHAALLLRLDAAGAVATWANQAAQRSIGGPGPDGFSWSRVGESPRTDDHGDPLAELLRRGGGRQDLQLRRADGSTLRVRVHAYPLDVAASLWVAHLDELTEMRRATEELQASEDRMRALAGHAPIGILVSEAGLRLGFVNGRAAELLGRQVPDLLSTAWLQAVDERDQDAVVEALAATLEGREADLLLRVDGITGRWLRLRAAPVQCPRQGVGFIGSLEDVTCDRADQEALRRQATHDPLTGLPNRSALHARVEAVLSDRRDQPATLSLLFFDLDRFKAVNDSLGHAVGDSLLAEVAQRLRLRTRREDTLARFGGDEFVVLCPGVGTGEQAAAVARRMLTAFDEPIALAGRSLRMGASIGIVVAPDTGTTAEQLLRDADAAMYQAKASGRGGFSLFDPGARAAVDRRLRAALDLRRALAADEIVLAHRTVVDLRDAALIGDEVLLRWHHRDLGALLGPELAQLAEEAGVARDLALWALDRACADHAERRHAHPGWRGWVSVDVTPALVTDARFRAMAEAVVGRHGLAPSDLCLALPERVLADDSARGALGALRARGFRVAVDGVGAGTCGLADLRRAPVDILKVAAPLVAGMLRDPADRALVDAILRIAAALGVEAVAEGVETAEQRDALLALGCFAAQGGLLGEPADAPALRCRPSTPVHEETP